MELLYEFSCRLKLQIPSNRLVPWFLIDFTPTHCRSERCHLVPFVLCELFSLSALPDLHHLDIANHLLEGQSTSNRRSACSLEFTIFVYESYSLIAPVVCIVGLS